MTQKQESKAGSPGKLSLWFQQRMMARANTRIRRKSGKSMGMDLLILHTVGRRTGQRRESPVAWFADGEDARLVVASGGGKRNPGWYFNLMANPEQASIELHGHDAVPVTPRRLEGADRERAWQRIVAEQPRFAKYQNKNAREYPIVRLEPRTNR